MAEKPIEKQRVIRYSVDVYVTLAMVSLFAYLSLGMLAPFISLLLWAIILAVALYPLFEMLRVRIGGSAGMAGTIMALIGLLIMFIPSFFVVDSMVESLGDWSRQLQSGTIDVPPPNESVKSWPLIGGKLYDIWARASVNLETTLGQFAPQFESAARFMFRTGAGLVAGILQFALSIIFASVFMCFAGPLADNIRRFASRIASQRGRNFVDMAESTIRGVSRGILGVAFIQGGLATIGIFVAGMPFAGFIVMATIGACIVQVPPLVIIPTIILAWYVKSTTVALIFTVYMLLVMFSDNILKPVLLARGLTTPMAVIFIGVIGGTITNGLLGLFIGPVILALFYEMAINWVNAPDDLETEIAAKDDVKPAS